MRGPGRVPIAIVLLLAPCAARAVPFAEPLRVDRFTLFDDPSLTPFVEEFDQPIDLNWDYLTFCGSAVASGNGFLEVQDASHVGLSVCPDEERFRLLLGGELGGYGRYPIFALPFAVTFSDAPAEGEFIAAAENGDLDPSTWAPTDFIQFEVRRVDGQLLYGARDETGSVGFTNTLAFTDTLVLEIFATGGGFYQLRYSTAGAPFVDVTAELAGLDGISSYDLSPTIEAGLLPEPGPAVLGATAMLALAALRRARAQNAERPAGTSGRGASKERNRSSSVATPPTC